MRWNLLSARVQNRFPATCLIFGATVAVGMLQLTGCNRSDSPPLGQVEGVVTVNGTPLEQGRVYFIPEDGGRTSEGEIGAGGKYRLIYSLDEFGAKVGTHTVKISTQNEFGGGERIPDIYNAKSELTATVNKGKQQVNFDLEEALVSGAKPKRPSK